MIRQPIITVMGHVDHGKCVSGETLLELGDGKLITAESAFERFRYNDPIYQPDGLVYQAKDLKLLSIDERGTVTSKKAAYVWKLTSKSLIRVNTRAGYEIKTTPEHKFLTYTKKNEIVYVEGTMLKVGDSLLIPSKIITSPIGLEELKKQIFLRLSDIFLLKVSKELNSRITAFCRQEGIEKLGRKFGDVSLNYHIRKGYYRPSILRLILSLLPYPEDGLYDQIEKIKFSTTKRRAGHKSFWLKIPHTQVEFAALYYVIGLLYGDGIRGDANLSNTSEVIIDEFKKNIKKSFGIGTTAHWRRTSFIVCHKGGKTFKKFLSTMFEYPEIDKTRILQVPDLICMSSNDLVCKFIQGFFDAEGYVQAENNMKNVGVACESPLLMQQLPILLHRFGCFAHFVKRKTKRFELCISGSLNLHAFYENINFREPRKSDQLKKNLENTVSSRVFEMTPLNGQFVKELRSKYDIKGKRNFDLSYYESKKTLTRHVLLKLLDSSFQTQTLPLNSILSSYRMVQITELETLDGDFSVYDFTVEDTHNFIANGLIVHNTTLLDKIRNTTIAHKEAGGITQHIGASEVPIAIIEKVCGPLLKKFGSKINIPGLLFIDTPGHEAFTNLRRRGGSVADLAILVVDITKSFEPQTYEAIEILKEYKTPFIVAANKIDTMTGWRINPTTSFTDTLSKQQPNVVNELDAKLYGLIGKLSEIGFASERFDRVRDFQKEVVVVPVSAKTGEGIAELLVYVTGLSQKFLEKRLEIETNEPGRGSILEKREEKGLGTTIDVILYNGTLKVNDTVAFATELGVGTAKIKALLKPKALQEMRDSASKFYPIDSVAAASGIKISGSGLDNALPGSLILSTDIKDYEQEIKSELQEAFSTDKTGVVLKTDTIGSLEAISRLLKNINVKISKKGLGKVSKRDVLDAFAMRAIDHYSSIVLAFNVPFDEEAETESVSTGVKIINEKVIYQIIEDYKEWVSAEKLKEKDEAEKMLTFPAMIKVLPNHCFRVSHPAVFGVDIVMGRIKSSVSLMNKDGKMVGKLSEIQDDGVSLPEAKKGDSVAISVNDAIFGRNIKDNDVLFVHVDDENARMLRTKFEYLLNDEEKALLEKVSNLKRSE